MKPWEVLEDRRLEMTNDLSLNATNTLALHSGKMVHIVDQSFMVMRSISVGIDELSNQLLEAKAL
jgi:hypothetical protein